MGCCGGGSRRASWSRLGGTGSGTLEPGSVRLRWRRRVTASVTGPDTGRTYLVSMERPVVDVDSRDASGLLTTGFFERIG